MPYFQTQIAFAQKVIFRLGTIIVKATGASNTLFFKIKIKKQYMISLANQVSYQSY